MKPYRILLADDDVWVWKRFLSALQQCGYELIFAADGREALEKLQQESFDLLILDVMMPYVDGIEVLKTVRMDPGAQRVPVIMMTPLLSRVYETERFHAPLREMGADDFLHKLRLDNRELRAKAQQLLAGSNPNPEPGSDDHEG